MLNGPYPQARGAISKSFFVLIFTAGLFASLQNIHEIEEECVLFSFKDSKSRWEVMMLMVLALVSLKMFRENK